MAHRQQGSIFQRGATWWVRFKKRETKPDGSAKWRSIYMRVGPDKGLAIEKLNDVRSQLDRERVLGVPVIGAITLRDFWSTHARSILRSRLSADGYDTEEKRVERMCEFLADDVLRDIDEGRVEELRAWLANEHGCSPATQNRYTSTLSVILKLAVQRRYARENVARSVKRHREELRAVPYLSPVDLERVYSHCRGVVRQVAVLAAETGLRRGELIALAWHDVDLERQVLVVRRSKNKTPRAVELTPRAEATLRELLEERGAVPMTGTDRVLPAVLQHGAKEIYAKSWLSHAFAAAAARAGFPTLSLHGLRHAFCSSLAQAGVPLPTIQALAGHSSITITARYAAHLPEGATRAAIDRLAAARGQSAARPQTAKKRKSASA
jgi:integrase